MKKNKLIKNILCAVLCVGVGAGGMYLLNFDKIRFADKYPLMLEIEEFMIEDAGIGAPKNPTDENVINAYLSMYGDKYTFCKNVDVYSKEYILSDVNYSATALGTGFELDFDDDDRAYFSFVDENKPAYEQGIRVGDVILTIGEQEIVEYKNIKKIKGEDKSTVKLLIERDGKEMSIDLLRYHQDEAEDASAKKIGDILYIDYNSMSVQSGGKIAKFLSENDFNSVILDLRDNGGGDVALPLSVADHFINKADVKSIYHNGDVVVQSTNDGIEYDVPIVVLINENTASSAEILTALLRQYADTKTVGVNSFGKGIFQSQGLYKGNSLQYTDGYIEVGDWECYHEKGIAPDYEVRMKDAHIGTDDDIQLKKAIELLS